MRRYELHAARCDLFRAAADAAIPNSTVKGSSVNIVARLLWIMPAILFFLTIHQILVSIDIRETYREGVPATAEITEFDLTDRSEVKHAFVGLRVRMDDGTVIEKSHVAVPYTLIHYVRDRDEVDVLVSPDADQDVVFLESGDSHWRIAAVNSAMSFLGFLMFFAGVFWWNRYLARHGDPARRGLVEGAA